jgi:hypothetical protein
MMGDRKPLSRLEMKRAIAVVKCDRGEGCDLVSLKCTRENHGNVYCTAKTEICPASLASRLEVKDGEAGSGVPP